jgi:hypothetical protein
MATRKKTTRRSRSSTSGGLESVQSDERTAEAPPSDIIETQGSSFYRASGEDLLTRVRQLIAEHPLAAVIGVASLAVTIALAARD